MAQHDDQDLVVIEIETTMSLMERTADGFDSQALQKSLEVMAQWGMRPMAMLDFVRYMRRVQLEHDMGGGGPVQLTLTFHPARKGQRASMESALTMTSTHRQAS